MLRSYGGVSEWVGGWVGRWVGVCAVSVRVRFLFVGEQLLDTRVFTTAAAPFDDGIDGTYGVAATATWGRQRVSP